MRARVVVVGRRPRFDENLLNSNLTFSRTASVMLDVIGQYLTSSDGSRKAFIPDLYGREPRTTTHRRRAHLPAALHHRGASAITCVGFGIQFWNSGAANPAPGTTPRAEGIRRRLQKDVRPPNPAFVQLLLR